MQKSNSFLDNQPSLDQIKKKISIFAQNFPNGDEQKARTVLLNHAKEQDAGLGYLVDNNLAQRLNIIFDMDHTLIYAINKDDLSVRQEHLKNVKVIKVMSKYEFVLVIRQGALEMLEYLSLFCNLYVYSHGLRGYIIEILEQIDPKQRFFPDRNYRVIAPSDEYERDKFRSQGKQLKDFRKPGKKELLFSPEQLDLCLLIDDQYMAIQCENQKYLIQSKKFLKYNEFVKDPNKRLDNTCYQYPVAKQTSRSTGLQAMSSPHGSQHKEQPCELVRHDDYRSHQDLNRPGDDNQLYHIVSVINRLFMLKFHNTPEKPIYAILDSFKKLIFKDMKFSFAQFDKNSEPADTMTDSMLYGTGQEITHQDLVNKMKKVCLAIIQELGGIVVDQQYGAQYWVYYDKISSQTILLSNKSHIHYTFITECFFALALLSEKDYKITLSCDLRDSMN